MAWVQVQGYEQAEGEWIPGYWIDHATGQISQTDPNAAPAPNLYGWDPNMAVPVGGFTVGQLLAPNYLSQGYQFADDADLRRAISSVAPGYAQPSVIDMNAQVPNDQVRAPAADNGFENLIGAAAMAGLGYLSGGFGIGDLLGSFSSPSVSVSSGGMPAQVAGWSSEMPTFSGSFDPSLSWGSTVPNYTWTPQQADSFFNLGGSGYFDAPIGTTYPDSVWTDSDASKYFSSGGSSLFDSPLSSLSKLLGGQSSGSSGLFGSLFGNNGLTSVLDRGVGALPVMAAIDYAKNQTPIDTSRLEGLYNQFNPNALAYQYDQNTLAGRSALTDSLTNRGVMGSSFGDQSLTNYNTSRDLGRSSLLNQGIGKQADIAGRIADMNFKSRQLKNQLYGSSLLALGNVFGGRSSPTINLGGI